MVRNQISVLLASAGLAAIMGLTGCRSASQATYTSAEWPQSTLAVAEPIVPELLPESGAESATADPFGPSAQSANSSPYEEPAIETDIAGSRPVDNNATDSSVLTDTKPAPNSLDAATVKSLRGLGAIIQQDADGRILVVDLTSLDVDDSDLANFSDVESLEQLGLRQTRITDDGLSHISNLTALQLLDLGNTEIGDEGLRSLTGLNQLQYLLLDQTRVTENGLTTLQDMTSLQGLSLVGIPLQSDALQALQAALPNCQIVVDEPAPEEPARPVPARSADDVKDEAEDDADTVLPVPAKIPQSDEASPELEFPADDETEELETGISAATVPALPVTASGENTAPIADAIYSGQATPSENVSSHIENDVEAKLETNIDADLDADLNAAGITHYHRGVKLAQAGNIEGALFELTQVMTEAEAHYTVGVILYRNALRAGEEQFLLALQRQPQFNAAEFWLSEIGRQRGRMPRRIDPFEIADSYDLLPLPVISPRRPAFVEDSTSSPTTVRQAGLVNDRR